MLPVYSPYARIQAVFAPLENGRPPVYDYLWEHAPQLISKSAEKNILVEFHTTKRLSRALNGWVAKLSRDKRYKTQFVEGKEHVTSVRATVPVTKLDQFLNAYNILFEHVLGDIRIIGKNATIDFSRAGENTIVFHTNTKMKTMIEKSLNELPYPVKRNTMSFDTMPRGD